MRTVTELKQMQSLPLDAKIQMSLNRIKTFIERHDGLTFCSISGGKDSRILEELCKRVDPEMPIVFGDTGLEYPEVRAAALSRPDVVVVRPKTDFYHHCTNNGLPIFSKLVSKQLRTIQENKPTTENVRKLILTGYNRKGQYLKFWKLAEKYRRLIDGPVKFSERCCDTLKKTPLHEYAKDTGRKAIVGTMASESRGRLKVWLEHGCEITRPGKERLAPMSFWTDKDVWEYAERFGIRFAEVYYPRVVDGVAVPAELRTGCMFCAFGVHLEDEPNRFQRMKLTHPKQYAYCMDKLGFREALKFCEIAYE